jgi:hypothetical protein
MNSARITRANSWVADQPLNGAGPALQCISVYSFEEV